MIPGPRPSQGHPSPATDGDGAPPPAACTSSAPVSVTRTPRGWAVHSPAGVEIAADLVEGLSLADLVAEELGVLSEPDRTARRSARGPAGDAAPEQDGTDPRIAALERTVAQLEHALAARVSTERAIGVLAERHGISARTAFDSMRRDARSQGRPVAELAREVLDGLAPDAARPEPDADSGSAPSRSVAAASPTSGAVVAAVSRPEPRTRARRPGSVAATDRRS
jgi:hypothetical protein